MLEPRRPIQLAGSEAYGALHQNEASQIDLFILKFWLEMLRVRRKRGKLGFLQVKHRFHATLNAPG